MNGLARHRRIVFAALCVVCISVAIAYTGRVVVRRESKSPESSVVKVSALSPAPTPPAVVVSLRTTVEPVATKPAPISSRLLFSSTTLDENFGKLGITELEPGTKPRFAGVPCERVHYAAGRGICLAADRGAITTYSAILFNDAFKPLKTIPLGGPPSRVRVAPNGKTAVLTVFVSGHSYNQPGFSTLTTIVDTSTGEVLTDMEKFEVSHDGERFQRQDFNFWGVTFASDSDSFYATLSTGTSKYLIKGSILQRRARVVRDKVECPSLSPDGRWIVFKSRLESPFGKCRFHLLDTATMEETPLAETRNVDDQAEWLDNKRILYGLPETEMVSSARMDIWVMGIRDSSSRMLISNASSPAVIRYHQ